MVERIECNKAKYEAMTVFRFSMFSIMDEMSRLARAHSNRPHPRKTVQSNLKLCYSLRPEVVGKAESAHQ